MNGDIDPSTIYVQQKDNIDLNKYKYYYGSINVTLMLNEIGRLMLQYNYIYQGNAQLIYTHLSKDS